MAEAVAAAIESGNSLLVQAGTGTGKSLAYLVPTLLASVGDDRRVLIATATLALQRQLLTRDLPIVAEALELPRKPSTALLKGRANYACRLRLDASGADLQDQILPQTGGALEEQAQLVREWVQDTETGDRDDLPEPVDSRVWRAFSVSGRECVGRARCPFGEECFFEIARDRAREADVVVTNHTLLAISLDNDQALPDYDVVVIDEAHELVSRVTSAVGGSLSAAAVADLPRVLGKAVPEDLRQRVRQAADAYASSLDSLAASTDGGGRVTQLPTDVTRALALLRDVTTAATSELTQSGDELEVGARQRLLATVADVHDQCGELLAADAATVVWLGSTPGPALHTAPLSVADLLSNTLFAEATVVATSATLALGGSFAATASSWGLGAEGASWQGLDVGSPFDYARQAVRYIPADLPAPVRQAISDESLAALGELVRAAGGRTLVLASSWWAVDRIGEYLLDSQLPDIEILVQQRGSPVTHLVEAFRDDETSVLVGTISLWQGVDVPGPSCRCVVIDKLPFPRPDDPVLAARSEAAERAGGSGFRDIQLPHAALLLAQGVGRLIRRADDRGVVAILDSRLATKSYRHFLLASLPPMWPTSDRGTVLAALRRLSDSA